MSRPSPPRARAAFALSLSYLCPGWGHVYAGDRLRGLIAFSVVAVLVLPAWVVAGTRFEGLPATMLAISGAWLLWIGLPLDAARRALTRRPPGGLTAVGTAAAFLVAGQLALGAELSLFQSGIVKLFHIPTLSMSPTLMPGDLVLGDVRGAGRRVPALGEVIVFEAPDREWGKYAKRVVAGPGSEVALENGRLVVDGRAVSASSPDAQGQRAEWLGDFRYQIESSAEAGIPDFGPVRVPTDHVFVLGDSRSRSVDSRAFGPIPVSSIQARAVRVVWSQSAVKRSLTHFGHTLRSLFSGP